MTNTNSSQRLRARPAASARWRGVLAGFLALALIATACGDDSQDTSDGAQPTVLEPEPRIDEPETGAEPDEPDAETDAADETETETGTDGTGTDGDGDGDTGTDTGDDDGDTGTGDGDTGTGDGDTGDDDGDTGDDDGDTGDDDGDDGDDDGDDGDDGDTGDDDGDTGTGDGDTGTDAETEPETEPETEEPETDEQTDEQTDAQTDKPETEEPETEEPETEEPETDEQTDKPETDAEPEEPETDAEPERNVAPTFDEGDSAARSVDETASAGDPVGDPVVASDGDGDTLIYSLDGPDAASFAIDFLTGQIRTRAALDRSVQAAYTLTIAVSDGKDSGGDAEQPAQTDDTIEVTVTVDEVVVAEFAALTVHLAGDTATPVTSVDGPGQRTFTVVGTGWTGLHTMPVITPAGNVNNPVLFLTSCLVPNQGEFDFFRQCDSDGLHQFTARGGVDIVEGSQELSSIYVSDAELRATGMSTGLATSLAELNVGRDGSFIVDMAVDVPAGGVIIAAVVGSVNIAGLYSPDLFSIIKAVTVEIPA